MHKTLVLNSYFMPIAIIPATRAYTLFYKDRAIIITEYEEVFKTVNPDRIIKKPSIIRVPQKVTLDYRKIPLSRENIFRRDNWECVYCGEGRLNLLTLDHVIPKSRGGEDSWENLVTACKSCNNEKDNLTAEEWGRPNPQPKRPHFIMMTKKMNYKIPDDWKDYLFY
jgi:CRISPR/Cas system Type II protein with McrA/HNH and RuvC-like nuclease domain